MLKVYSPDGVSWRLWNNPVSAAAAEASAKALNMTLQRDQIFGLDIVAAIIGTFTIEVEIGWPVNAAELRFLGRPARQRDDDRARGNCATLPVVPIIDLAIDAAAAHAQAFAGHDRADQAIERGQQ